MNMGDTIAALATAPGEGAIAIIRVSGPQALAIADRVFCAPPPRPSDRPGGSFVYGRIGRDGAPIVDEGVLLIFRAPRSYTREDLIELQCHGGRESAKRVLRAVLEAGARPAQPGEFTRRAFLNGRLDLTQAEAVMDLIAAQSDLAAAAAVEQLNGELSRETDLFYDEIVGISADLESTLDFSEDELPESVLTSVSSRIKTVEEKITNRLVKWEDGYRLREGVLVVITGRTNAGKSTLLNRLLGRARAIVSPTPGTTRDTIEETLLLEGFPIRLVDTAGLRETTCAVEQEGIARARATMGKADLVIHVIDSADPDPPADRAAMAGIPRDRLWVLLNKQDLAKNVTLSDYEGYDILETSLIEPVSRPALLAALRRKLDLKPQATPHATISERHRLLLLQADRELSDALAVLRAPSGIVLSAIHLRDAAKAIGQISGRIYYDDLLDQVFSRFCIGK